VRTLLVTGASGFVGRHALEVAASRGFAVHAVAHRDQSGVSAPGAATWHRADLLREADRADLLEAVRPSHLLHFAWIAEHGRYWEAPENDLWVESSLDLVDRFAAQGGRRVTVAGTCAEYDWSAPLLATSACSETATPCQPHTLYGRSKLRFARELEKRGGVSHAWGRLFLLYGPSEDPRRLIPSVVRALRDGQVARIGPGTQVRDFLDVRDAAAAFVAVLDSSLEGAVNVGSGVGVSIADVARRLAELMGHPELLRVGALPARPDDPPRLVPDVSRLTETGFRPSRSLVEGLSEAIAWWRAHRES